MWILIISRYSLSTGMRISCQLVSASADVKPTLRKDTLLSCCYAIMIYCPSVADVETLGLTNLYIELIKFQKGLYDELDLMAAQCPMCHVGRHDPANCPHERSNFECDKATKPLLKMKVATSMRLSDENKAKFGSNSFTQLHPGGKQ